VLFPIPGSPPNKIKDPEQYRLQALGLIQSQWCPFGLLSRIYFIDFKALGFALRTDSFQATFLLDNSAIVFHSLQELHCPWHLAVIVHLTKKGSFTGHG
jgi:hypothetical protein